LSSAPATTTPAVVPLITGAFMLLVTAHFLQALGFSSMPLLPVYLDHVGADRAAIGVVMGSASVGGLLTRPVVGWALDVVGRRATVVTGTLLLAASMSMLALVESVGPLVILLRVVFGVGVGALFTAYFTFVVDVIPESRRTEGIALFGISGLLPLAINPFVGQLGLSPGSLRWVFPAISIAVLASLLAALRVPEPGSTGPEGERFSWSGALAAIVSPQLVPVWWATAVFGGAVSVFLAFATVAAESRGLANPGAFFLTYAGGAAAMRVVGARLPERVGHHNLLAPSLAACGIGLVGLALSGTQTWFLVWGLVAGIGHGFAFPVIMGQLVDRVPAAVRGSAVAAFTGLFDLSILVSTPVMGEVADRWTDAWMFVCTAALVGVGLVGWVILEHRLAPEN